jgi:tRNA pseudouridine55 synthase
VGAEIRRSFEIFISADELKVFHFFDSQDCKSKIQNPQSKIEMDGILIIDKPETWTSHDVVGKLRRLLKTKRIGHTGTLDPFATGVLVMLVGQATRLAQFLDKDQKEYEATIQFGFETNTGDLTGMRNAEYGMKNEEIAEILSKTNWDEVFANFRGEILQTPPMYSAKKVDGKKLYELARKGVEIERNPVAVNIYELEIQNSKFKIQNSNEIRIRVVCSAGTYIRTLAEDIGRKIGVPCHLSALRRTRAGKFDLTKALTLEGLEKLIESEKLDDILIPMNQALSHLPQKILDERNKQRVKNGMKIPANFKTSDVLTIRMTDEAENLVAIGFYDSNAELIQPRIVFAE